MKPQHVIAGVIGAALMGFVIYSSVFPYPAYPFNYLPPAFALYLIIGLIWFAILKSRSPQILASISNDMEGMRPGWIRPTDEDGFGRSHPGVPH